MDSESLVLGEYTPKLEDFRQEKWCSMSPRDRLSLLKYAEELRARAEKRIPREIVPMPMEEGEEGYYDPNDPYNIYINEDLLLNKGRHAPYRALHTVYHEGRHAFQDDCVNGRLLKAGEIDKVDKEKLRQWKIQFLEGKYNDGPDPDDENAPVAEYYKYYFQPCEDDAEEYALEQLKALAETLGDKDCLDYTREFEALRGAYSWNAKMFWGKDYKQVLLKDLEEREEEDEPVLLQSKKPQQTPRPKPAESPGKRNYVPLQLGIFGVTLAILLVMYWIAKPSGLIEHALWILSAAIPFVPVILLLRSKSKFAQKLRNKKGGILLMVLFALLLLMIQKFYYWLSIAFLVFTGFFLFKNIAKCMPNTLTIIREEADGTTSTETRIIGDDVAGEMRMAESQLRSEGYTRKY